MVFRRGPRRKLPHSGVYTRLQPSPLHGVGVFAIRTIRRGTRIFSGDTSDMVWMRWRSLRRLPRPIWKLYEDFAVFRGAECGRPTSFNSLTVAWYSNHSDHPNVGCDEHFDFFALKDIRPGEELTTAIRHRRRPSLRATNDRGFENERVEHTIEYPERLKSGPDAQLMLAKEELCGRGDSPPSTLPIAMKVQ